MKNISSLRKINNFEKRNLIQSLSKIGPILLNYLNRTKINLYILENNLLKINPRIFLVESKLVNLADKLNRRTNIVHLGVYFGFFNKNVFLLSLEGAEFLHKNKMFPENQKIIVNDIGEKSILYGNNLTKKMIVKFPEFPRKNDLVLIQNKNNEILALARLSINPKEFNKLLPNEYIATTLKDKGYYLRSKQ
ncbi:MAG: hypothetical protein ACTSRH_16885 [Promethearchaeota archaeon]